MRVNECYHRFHLLCLHRDWFMTRVVEKDQFGDTIVYPVPELKKCPTCRRVVANDEITYIKT